MKLRLGNMKNAELAEWFNITSKTFENSRKKYLCKLETFAKFTLVRGGVFIEDIFIDTYIKNLDDDVKIYLEEVRKAEDNITSISGISECLLLQEEFNDISLDTMRGRMRRAGIKAFGNTIDEDSKGLYGSRRYVWAIKLYDKPNHYRYMTQEEENIFDQYLSGYYLSEPQRIKKMASLEEAFKNSSSMTKEEYFKEKDQLNLNLFYDVISQFKKATGLQVVHATAHEIDLQYQNNAF